MQLGFQGEYIQIEGATYATCLKSQKEGSTNISSTDKLQLQITLGAFITVMTGARGGGYNTMPDCKAAAPFSGTWSRTRQVPYLRRKAAQASRQKTNLSCKLPFGAFIIDVSSRNNKDVNSWMPHARLLACIIYIYIYITRGSAFGATCLKSQKEGSTNISSKDKLQLQITLGAIHHRIHFTRGANNPAHKAADLLKSTCKIQGLCRLALSAFF